MIRLTDHPDMTIIVDWGIKQQNKQRFGMFDKCEQTINGYFG